LRQNAAADRPGLTGRPEPPPSSALTRAVAEGAFEPDGTDPLDFGLDCILDGVEALIAGR
jgi:hypothetical protein